MTLRWGRSSRLLPMPRWNRKHILLIPGNRRLVIHRHPPPRAIHSSKSVSHSVYHPASGCNIITYLIIIINIWPMSKSQSSAPCHARLLERDEYEEVQSRDEERKKADPAHWMMIIRCGRIKEAKWWRREDRKSPFQSFLLLCWAQIKPNCSSAFSFFSVYIFYRSLYLLSSQSPATKF